MSPSDHSRVALTIMNQLGGRGRLCAMTGARDLLSGHGDFGGLSFKFGRGKFCKIELTAADDYTLTLGSIRKHALTGAKTFTRVYADRLVPIFERETGLYLSL